MAHQVITTNDNQFIVTILKQRDELIKKNKELIEKIHKIEQQSSTF